MNGFLFAVILLAQLQVETGTVSGRLLSRNGSPAAGVRIAASPVVESNGANTAPVLIAISQTDATGNYRLEGVPSGRYHIVAGLIDYPSYYPGAPEAGGATAIVVEPGGTVTGIDFSLSRALTLQVSGRISGPAAVAGNADRFVTLGPRRPTRGGTAPLVTRVEPDGSFLFPQVPRGEYRLASGVRGASFVDFVVSENDVENVLLPVVDCSSGVQVRGRLVGIASPPIVSVALTGARFRCAAEAAVNANGEFVFDGIPEDAYAIRLTPIPRGFADRTLLVANKNLEDVEISLPVIFELKGKVTVDNGSAPPRLSRGNSIPIQAWGPNGNQGVTQPIGDDGAFSLQLLEGTYRVSVAALPANYYVKSIAYGSVDLSRTPLELEAPVSNDILVTLGTTGRLQPGVRVSGRVIPPVAGALSNPEGVLLVSSNGGRNAASFEAPLLADGSFEFQGIRPGSYDLQTLPDSPVSLREIAVQRTDVAGLEFALPVLFKVNGSVEWVHEKGSDVPSAPANVSVQFSKNDETEESKGLLVWAALVQDGAFQAYLPEGDYRFSIAGGPAGLAIKSVAFGSSDLAMSGLRVVSNLDPMNIRVVLRDR